MEKKWEEMSAKEKREARFKTWLSAEGVKFQSPEAENTYKKAVTRFKDAVLIGKDTGSECPYSLSAPFSRPTSMA